MTATIIEFPKRGRYAGRDEWADFLMKERADWIHRGHALPPLRDPMQTVTAIADLFTGEVS